MARFAGRRLDQFYFVFCVIISFGFDFQPLYPPSWIADTPLPRIFEWSLKAIKDPIMTAASSADGGGPEYLWLRCFMPLEALFQVPTFILGAIALWKNDKRVYPLLVAYGASTATTLLPCLAVIWNLDPKLGYTTMDLIVLTLTYAPFLVIPGGMAIDMGLRIGRIISTAQERKSV